MTWHHVGLRYWRGPRSVNLERCHQDVTKTLLGDRGCISKKFKDQIMIQIQKALLIQSAPASILHFSGHSRCPGGLLIDEFSAIRSSRFESFFAARNSFEVHRSPCPKLWLKQLEQKLMDFTIIFTMAQTPRSMAPRPGRDEWDGLPYKRMAG